MSVIDISSHVFFGRHRSDAVARFDCNAPNADSISVECRLAPLLAAAAAQLGARLNQYSKQYASNFRPVGRDLPALEAVQQQNFAATAA
jgi:hypothetical protein